MRHNLTLYVAYKDNPAGPSVDIANFGYTSTFIL